MEEPSVMGCSSMGYHSQTPPHPTTTATTFENSCYRSLLDSDVVSDDDSDWREDEWPQDRPLPLPEWGRERASLAFASLRDYMSFLSRVASHQRQTISIHPYDSVSNFIEFSEEYMASEFTSLQEFYRYYDPPLVSGRYSCVGLAADLASRLAYLEGHYPGFKDAIYQVSCEEELKDDYIGRMISSGQITTTTCIKEHMLLCVRVCVEGRAGVVLLDPGYHLPHPVTVMEDGLSPHSGPVNAATARSNVVRTYRYYFGPSSSPPPPPPPPSSSGK
ncbi:uncharacterized protein LOC123514300 [Portunus trituberculatus]|uniref:uncharacterized protein LOC123514300 n=1 Tax=Portunus trituberculatus TaxID=210409 RepID=UPI001E1CD397|nr:uncharacterized protein LOC123514300 [Portunus trituberculatus]XP_045128057.1 uncharacterized protein LOC123514300 [Portunus trituberculatus]XP_045128058.1 uncharacterized protein LOC123514300 [Portunus trituberculatus]